jgi:endonuclease/exonuclease/phosphatase (EEP) superfamily protein YafD
MTLRTLLPVCAASFALGSCSTMQTQPGPTARPAIGSHAAPVFEDAAACRDQIARPRQVLADNGFDVAQLGLLSWNMKKGERARWQHDLARMAHDKDLVLIQEASLDDEFMSMVESSAHWSFAPGYRSGRSQTGVMTLSTQPPLAQCNLQAVEPVLGTPKATSITQFALWNSADTLLVANIHAVNFSLGLAEFSSQIDDLRTVLSAHTGPIILSGDFNTWRPARIDIVDALLKDVGLERVDFAADHRTRFLGLPLDHLFVRGLSMDAATTQPVRSSDHNPLTAAFSLSTSATTYYTVDAKDTGEPQEVSL